MQFYGIKKVSSINSAAICLISACALTISAHATTLIVSNTSDNGPGSLRQSLADATDGDTIDATGISGVITLTSGELLVDKSVTINGAGADVLAVDGNATSRVFQITSGQTVTIADLTIRNGHAPGTDGGGILNDATLTITNCTVSGNTGRFGGGAFNSGTLTIVNCTVSGNTAVNGNKLPGEGAGTYNADASTLTITNSTFSGNVAAAYGGASFNTGTLQISNSTFSDNSSTFLAGGVVNLGTFEIGNTILNRGDSGVNIYNNGGGTVTSLGYNLSSDDGSGYLIGPGDQINTDPLLGPLQNNGGPTLTHELLAGSPAIDAGDPNFTPPPFFDQRGQGFPRVVNDRIDKGSFEVQSGGTPTPTPTTTMTPTPTTTPTATPTATATATATPSATATATATPSPTATTSPRPTPSPRGAPAPRPRPTPVPRPALEIQVATNDQ